MVQVRPETNKMILPGGLVSKVAPEWFNGLEEKRARTYDRPMGREMLAVGLSLGRRGVQFTDGRGLFLYYCVCGKKTTRSWTSSNSNDSN